jgi:two-component system sensor histidine kinase PilS (NtrC family)
MSTAPEAISWYGATLLEPGTESGQHPPDFERLWRAFMTARATLGFVLVLLQAGILVLTTAQNGEALLIATAYFGAALAVRLITQPQHMGQTFDRQWLRTVGIDLLTFAALQAVQSHSINYTPLFALPVLMASVLGSLIMAMGTAAGVTLLLFAYASWASLQTPWESTSLFIQAALTGSGCFAISFIASQLATRLASVELRAQRSQLAATAQRQVNELVVAALSEGILVVDEQLRVRSANPAARALLGLMPTPANDHWHLTEQQVLQELGHIVAVSQASKSPQQAELTVRHEGRGPRRLWVRTQITPPLPDQTGSLCVVFLQDQRELQARLRTEKLASMGRMSAAVAHEIRNPLAAIVQANALLAEDLRDPTQLRMTDMVQQNAQRLEKIVHDILHLTHTGPGNLPPATDLIDMAEVVGRVCRDWHQQAKVKDELSVRLSHDMPAIQFDPEHLRRITINLLDNAFRFASHRIDAIQVSNDRIDPRARRNVVNLRIWSDGEPLEPSVEQHLFEPFFSSDSRSSGLGLYICRELCQSQGASMAYDRNTRLVEGQERSGNEFSVSFRTRQQAPPELDALRLPTP